MIPGGIVFSFYKWDDDEKHEYTAIAKPPLSNADHNTAHLICLYKTSLKSSKPLVMVTIVWTDDSILTLKGCFGIQTGISTVLNSTTVFMGGVNYGEARQLLFSNSSMLTCGK